MRTYADPHLCPDCGAPLPAGSSRCAACGLDLGGELGQELFATLTRADALLARMRLASRAAVTVGAPAPTAPAPVPTGVAPEVTAPAAAPARPAMRATSVPKILLTLGALCLLVAAIVFLVVTWSVMGVGGRTATLVAFTLTTGALTWWTATKHLRGAVEALGTVTLGLFTLDLLGARNAGWLGSPSDATFQVVLGLLVFVASVGAVLGLQRSPVQAFLAGEVVATLGAFSYAVGMAGGDWADRPVRLVAGLVGAAACTGVVVALGRMRVALVGTGTVTALMWLTLFSTGLAELGAEPSLASVWGDLDAWPLLVAAALAATLAAVHGVPLLLRLAAVNGAVLALALVAVAPASDEPTTELVVAVLLATLVLSALVAWAPRPWGAGGLVALTVASVVNGVVGLALVTDAAGRYLEVASHGWAGPADGRLPQTELTPPIAEPWLLPLCTVALVIAVWVVARLSEPMRALDPRRPLAVGAGGVAMALLAMTLLYPVPVWLVLGLLLVAATAVGVRSVLDDDPRLALATAAAGTVALGFSLYDELHTLVAAVVLTGLAAAHHLRSRHPAVATLSGGAVPALVALAVWTGGALAEVGTTWLALTGILVLAALALGRVRVPSGPVPGAGAGVEVGAALTAVPLAAAGLSDPGLTNAPTWLAVYLTVAGTAASLMALTRSDRRWVGWLGGALLVLATWVRLWDIGVDEPEPYTLPSALALLVVGGVALRRHPELSTQRALGTGLALALGPSLLWALQDPESLRALLLGVACLGLVVAGAQLRWSAPLTYGALAGLLLVLREAGPYVGDAVPRWALIGLAGALLITLGVTWESRLRDARRVMGYVRGLR